MRIPTHPGLILYSGFVEDSGLTITAIANHLGFSRENLSRVLHGKSPITQNMALRLEAAGISTARQWLSLQLKYDLSHIEPPKHIKPLTTLQRSSARPKR